MITKGVLYTHTRRPEWGYGMLVNEHARGLYRMRFSDRAGIVRCTSQFLRPVDLEQTAEAAKDPPTDKTPAQALLADATVRLSVRLGRAPKPRELAAELGIGQASVRRMLASEVERVLAEVAGNVSAAARKLGVDRTTVYRVMRRNGLEAVREDVAAPVPSAASALAPHTAVSVWQAPEKRPAVSHAPMPQVEAKPTPVRQVFAHGALALVNCQVSITPAELRKIRALGTAESPA